MQTLENLSIKKDTRILVRCDLDVPLKNSVPENTFRLDSNLKTLRYILENEGHPVIMGKIGSPKGSYDAQLSTTNLIPYFDEKLGKGSYTLLENTRFDPREKQNDPVFAKELSQNGAFYVNECFATSHREDASIVGVAKVLPSLAGFHLAKEVSVLSSILERPQRPFVALIGGIKIESKLPTVEKLIQKADHVLLGGLLGLNWPQDKQVPENILMPLDYARDNKDIGVQTISKYKEILKNAKSVLWAGPMGAFEEDEFSTGTKELASVIASSQNFSVAGGGDTINAITRFGLLEKFDFISTGGGAMLEFLARGNLPGLSVLGYK